LRQNQFVGMLNSIPKDSPDHMTGRSINAESGASVAKASVSSLPGDGKIFIYAKYCAKTYAK
jgi:hypothetical protein